MKKIKQIRVEAFTLIEMLVVLLIISILILLFVPNLSKQKEKIDSTGKGAIVKVVESQAELFTLNKSKSPTLNDLLNDKSISKEQYDSYKDYYAKNTNESPQLSY